MWEHYNKLRISKPFKEEWEKFFQTSLCRCALPTVFQFVSHRVSKKLLELELKVAENNDTGAATCPMTWEEVNALRYVAGYICHKVQSKLAKSSVKDKEEMVLLWFKLCGDEEDEHRGTGHNRQGRAVACERQHIYSILNTGRKLGDTCTVKTRMLL